LLLEGHEYKIWIARDDSINSRSQSYYYFDNKNNCISLNIIGKQYKGYEKIGGTFRPCYYEDVIVSPIWSINKDTLFIEEIPYLIIEKDNDTIYLETKSKGKLFLIDAGFPPKKLRNK
jgi:hypothetical protein